MHRTLSLTQQRFIEFSLVITTLGIVCLTYILPTQKTSVLYLFFLPVILGGFFLGRYRAGVLAVLAVVSTTVVVFSDFQTFLVAAQPLAVMLQFCIWAGVLGLTAVIVGTLSEDRDQKHQEAREAQHGVIDVLRAYLQSINPGLQSRTQRVMELCDHMGQCLHLSEMELEDIRVATLLVDLEPVEITSRVIRRAVDELQENSSPRTFAGSELVCSLGSVLTTAFPIAQWVTQDHRLSNPHQHAPVSAEIIRAARAYDQKLHSAFRDPQSTPADVWQDLKRDDALHLPPAVLHALRQVISAGYSYSSTSTPSTPRRAPTVMSN